MPSTFWERTKGTSKKGFDKAWHTLDKLGDPVNRLSNRVGAEAFWPMAIDKESDKAARILRSFCKDGFYSEEDADRQSTDSAVNPTTGKIDRPKGKQRVLKKIPSRVIQQAKGLAIFTTMRTGLWLSGSGGSGVLLARIPETGEWSPPSGIMLHTAGIGFLAGVDIYDCVVVINTYEALEAFKKVRCTLGGEVSASAGPVGMGGVLESEVHKRQAPIWTYMKSRGLYAGVQVDGTIIIERSDENERFYGERISVTDILAGKAKNPPASIQTLMQTIKAAQGDANVDEALLPPPGEAPGDVELGPAIGSFGVPDPEDPDPFGVKALEAEGLFIREAGSRSRPSQEAFEFKPAPSSPIYATFRRSLDSSPRSSWRASVQSYASMDRGTQTDDGPATAPPSVSRASSRSYRDHEESRLGAVIPEHGEYHVPTDAPVAADVEDDLVDDDDLEVHEVSSATVSKRESIAHSPVSIEDSTMPSELRRYSPTFTRARLVTIPKRVPPALPPRHPSRTPGSISTSTPTSPTSLSRSHSRRRSVASSPGRSGMIGLTELPLHSLSDDSLSDSSSNAAAESYNKTSPDREDFHSVSSLHDSDAASEKEASIKEIDARLNLQNHFLPMQM
ncbi:hypothetical protein ASPACDRAFT_54208 [Aspergillus aculeatus ATCC 16872]|uniref:Ysc84 actin-binding domain-containing protein n=1 Tax=Aspergillus aculeatus (strain ATCC 16872 / CBS 172.66 / WB 5094) TaxID=690307 RepID=A0A1L9WKY7_ASPA1|nr:uncharacterized protein ASPACDRAFT_54208 [Aspergillus aculeatus ATCC 16872]OJJ96823.1 hypothetical protein ASPACDRAFT_54208 [Aspergillus aculeatus ATCC 16872]